MTRVCGLFVLAAAVSCAASTARARMDAGSAGGVAPASADLRWEFGDGRTSPDPDSTFGDCLCRSPANAGVPGPFQSVFRGVLSFNGTPVPGFPASQVELEILAPCANPVVLNPDGPSAPDGSLVWGPETLAQGGGACAGPEVVSVWVQGQLFWLLDAVRSPDVDGDGLIALNDFAVFRQAFAAQSPEHLGDLDCDGTIAARDLLFFQHHFVGH